MFQSKISQIISILLKIIFLGGILIIPFLPMGYDMIISDLTTPFLEQTILYRIAFFTCYFVSLGIILILIRLFDYIYIDPFTNKTVSYLKIISALFFVLSIIVFIKTIFIPTILSIAIFIITFIVSLCFYVLSQIFKIANMHKKELEYTI